jgi:hypothetical protein
MVMLSAGRRPKSETVTDLAHWVHQLSGCPEISRTKQAVCRAVSHGASPATWFYVEADATEGVARLRCLAGGHVQDLMDSDERWTYPGVWACTGCGQSIAEAVYGVHAEADRATWLALAVRCVNCGDVAGVTDLVLEPTDVDALLDAL